MAIKDEIITRIKRNYTAENICFELNLTLEELYNHIYELRNERNIYYYANICSDANIMFSKKTDPLESDSVFTIPNGEFKMTFISDPHVGNIFDNISRFAAIEDFNDSNDIKVLVCTGDLVDGPKHENQSVDKRLNDLDSQLDELASFYPYMPRANIVIVGDHDTDYRTIDGYNTYKVLKECRPDIKLYGSASGLIKVNNKEIVICHNVKDRNAQSMIIDDRMVVSGHSHIYYNHTSYVNNNPVIRLVCPSMSNLPLHNSTTPGFLTFTFTCSSNQVVGLLIDNYTFEGPTANILHNGNVAYQFQTNKQFSSERDMQRKKKK